MRNPNRYRVQVLSLISSLTLLGSPVAAQVRGDVIIHSGPISGRVILGPMYPRPYETVVYRPLPSRRVVVMERYAPRVVVVERGHRPHGRAHGWYRKHGYRPVNLYYHNGRFFDRVWYDRGYARDPRFQVVVVYERGGRFYAPYGGSWDDDRYYSTYDRRSSGYDDEYDYGESRHRRDYDDD